MHAFTLQFKQYPCLAHHGVHTVLHAASWYMHSLVWYTINADSPRCVSRFTVVFLEGRLPQRQLPSWSPVAAWQPFTLMAHPTDLVSARARVCLTVCL
jgi:hypothetical protein